ncbi:MAG: hypothetical protein NTW67_05995 [Candidatus Woesearchaeota archaeon]|nr:hypothetical protein [Candidatus Woesearchaeota archaeon]
MELFDVLVCPDDRTKLICMINALHCPKCRKTYQVKDKIPVFMQQ